jgi:hypothetical protein
MGHVRLGTLPDTKPWRRVIALIADGNSVPIVASATINAALRGLARVYSDEGLNRVVFLLSRVTLAARDEDFAASLDRLQITVPSEPTLFDLTAGFTAAVRDWQADNNISRTDFSEMGILAAVETLTRCIGERSTALFPNGDEVHRTVRDLSAVTGFAVLAHEFYARFTRRFLLYHLGRELPHHVGGNGRFADPSEHSQFAADLDTHCRETAYIVRHYAEGWYKKAKFEEGITERQARRFSSYCLTKLQSEMARRGARDG